MKFRDILKGSNGKYPQKRLIVLGVNPLISEITDNSLLFSDLLEVNNKLEITLIYESETENFNQSLFYSPKLSKNKVEFEKLKTFQSRFIGGNKGKNKRISGFIEDVVDYFENDKKENVLKRIHILQNNLRHNVNIICVDDIIWYSFTTLDIPSLDMFRRLDKESDNALYLQFNDYINFLLDKDEGRVFLSSPGDELIELYDMYSTPRGIYPRNAFYSTNYQRYSIWAFVFNRNGELLLHQRSKYTKDNRLLWDKSAGGHVDLTDSSTIITAKRELVEELFLPEAEFSKYMKADLGDIVDFGEWNIDKRPEKHFRSSFSGLDESDWVVFRATENGQPMTIKRKSPRKIHVKNKIVGSNIEEKNDISEHIEEWDTRFISDVFLFIAPEGYIDNESQMNELMKAAEIRGAAASHKLISIDDLIDDVSKNKEIYTDDMVYMCNEKSWLLTQFSESIKYIFRKEE